MKLVQLLTGAAAAALLAGAATAQTVTVVPGVGNIEEDTTLAAELTADVNGNLVLGLDFDGAFASLGASGQVDMVVTLLNAEFSGVVTNAPNGFTDNNCDFNIQSGGGAGGTTVTYRNASSDLYLCANVGAGTEAESTLSLPISVSNVGQSVDVSVAFVRNAGSAGYAGTTANFDLIDYEAVTSYTLTGNADASELLVTGTTLIDWSDVALAGDQGFLGNFASAAIGTADIDIDATAASYPAIVTDASTLVFGFDSVENITGITPTQTGGLDAGTGCAAPDATENSITCTIADEDVNDSSVNPLAFTLNISAADAVVAPQTITATFTPDEEAGFTDVGVTDADFALLDEDDGVSTTTIAAEFPWSSLRATGGTKSAFRITGLEASPSVINVILNSTYVRDGGTAPTESTVDITSIADIQEDPLNAGQFIATFTSEDIASLLGTDGGVNADIQFSVVMEDGTGTTQLEALRLLSTGGVVSGTGFDG